MTFTLHIDEHETVEISDAPGQRTILGVDSGTQGAAVVLSSTQAIMLAAQLVLFAQHKKGDA